MSPESARALDQALSDKLVALVIEIVEAHPNPNNGVAVALAMTRACFRLAERLPVTSRYVITRCG
jgi:hypothetical protein